jgi:hypothetical protein
MSDAFDFLTKWVRKNITPTTAHIHNDTLTAGRLAEECNVCGRLRDIRQSFARSTMSSPQRGRHMRLQ